MRSSQSVNSISATEKSSKRKIKRATGCGKYGVTEDLSQGSNHDSKALFANLGCPLVILFILRWVFNVSAFGFSSV